MKICSIFHAMALRIFNEILSINMVIIDLSGFKVIIKYKLDNKTRQNAGVQKSIR